MFAVIGTVDEAGWSWDKIGALAAVLGVGVAVIAWLIKPEEFRAFCKKCWWGIVPLCVACGVHFGWFEWLTVKAVVPVWGLLLLFSFGVSVVLLVLWIGMTIKESGQQPGIFYPVSDFKSAVIAGVRWHWDYFGSRIETNSFWAMCPDNTCKNRLQAEYNPRANMSATSHGMPQSLFCSKCGFRRDFDGPIEAVIQDVAIEVERLINSREYVTSMKRNAHD